MNGRSHRPVKGYKLFTVPTKAARPPYWKPFAFCCLVKKGKTYGYGSGYLVVEREGVSYHIGRDGKKLNFYPLGKGPISEEPAALWWHGLDKKDL